MSHTAVPRTAALAQLVAWLSAAAAAVSHDHPIRVGMDGIDCAGKTSLADELAAPLRARGHPVIRASIDSFHNPRRVRYRQGRDSAQGYFEDSFNLEAVQASLLRPLGPGGSRRYRTAVFDHRSDQPVDAPWETAVPNAILLFDGIFLHRPALRPHWDFSVFITISFAEMVARAVVRDRDLFASEAEIVAMYQQRYIPAQQRYLETADPAAHADVIWHNDDVQAPTLRFAGNPAA